jgi:hypothetical protein
MHEVMEAIEAMEAKFEFILYWVKIFGFSNNQI